MDVSYLFNHGEKITEENLLQYSTKRLSSINTSLKNIKTMYMQLCESRRKISQQISSELKKPDVNKE